MFNHVIATAFAKRSYRDEDMELSVHSKITMAGNTVSYYTVTALVLTQE